MTASLGSVLPGVDTFGMVVPVGGTQVQSWRMPLAFQLCSFAIAAFFTAAGVSELTGRGNRAELGILALVIGLSFTIPPARSRIVLTESELIIVNSLRSYRIDRSTILAFVPGQPGIWVSWADPGAAPRRVRGRRAADEAASRSVFAKAVPGVLGAYRFGHPTRVTVVADELTSLVIGPRRPTRPRQDLPPPLA